MEAKVTIRGTSPLLMNRFPLEPVEHMDKKSKEEQAEIAAYRIPETQELFIPGVAVQRALISAATYSKGRGRASLQKTAAACLLVDPECIPIGTKKYDIDSRAVVIPATKGRIIRHRPRVNEWKATFKLEWDEDLLTEQQVKTVVEDMGKRVGLLEFRPERKGPFGRSEISKWERSK